MPCYEWGILVRLFNVGCNMAIMPSAKSFSVRSAISGWLSRNSGELFTTTSLATELGLSSTLVGYELLRREGLKLIYSVGFDKSGPDGGRPPKLYKQKWLS